MADPMTALSAHQHVPAWYASCEVFANAEGLPPDVLDVLAAFGANKVAGDPSPPGFDATPAPFAAIEARVSSLAAIDSLSAAIEEVLTGEVDAAQAAMFGRRFRAVAGLLRVHVDGQPNATNHKRLWLVGLCCRVEEILEAAAPRALRIRAICDFYYSQAARLEHTLDGALPSLEVLVDVAVWTPCEGPGEYTRIAQPSAEGPLHINLLRVETPRLWTLDCRGGVTPRALRDVAAASGAWAGVSGGFFLYSEAGIEPPSHRTDPVGLLVHQGIVQNPPIFRRAALCQTNTGVLEVGPVGMYGVRISWGGQPVVVVQSLHDEAAIGQAVTFFNRAHHKALAPHSAPGFAFVGTEVVAAGVGLQEIPLAGGLCTLPEGAQSPAPGETLYFGLPVRPSGYIVEAMAGGPMLLSPTLPTLDLAAEDFCGEAPPITFSQDETFDQNLLPRMAAGLRPDGTLLFAAIDGRSFDKAPGLTLHQTARLMRAAGCIHAMNFDGGSSKRMVVDGAMVDLPNTEVTSGNHSATSSRIRPVHSAILLR